jgi:uncharacterized protein
LPLNNETVIKQTKEWIEKAVIGLNLCPFAKPVFTQNLIRYSISKATNEEELLGELSSELLLITQTEPKEIETTLLILPEFLTEFLEFNDFLGLGENLLSEMELEGIIQIASFHPQFQFAGTKPDDITNYTNRSPYPILHLLREDSVSKAVDSFPGVNEIPDKNIETLTNLGFSGWKKLGIPEV